MKVSLEVLKPYCFESWGCKLGRSSYTRSCMIGKFEFELIFPQL